VPLRKLKPTSPGQRFVVRVVTPDLHTGDPYEPLLAPLPKRGGRNNQGRITTRHQGGGHKRYYRVIDFRRNKDGVPGRIEHLEYDPNRSAHLALVVYLDGERRYILAPKGASAGDAIASGVDAPILMEHHSGLELVLGPGEAAIHLALDGELTITIALIALFAKMIATLATIGSGGSAGLLVPSLFFGTMVAAAFADLFAIPAQMLVIPAMTATLVAIVNVPLAAILFTVEVFGSIYMVPALIALVVTSILAHDNTVYRTQREATSKRQILPGASVRRVPIPAKWENQTLVDLDFRKQFDLNVIGLVEQQGEDGRPHIRLGSAATVVLQQGDILVVLGSDENLDALETAVKEVQGSRGAEERGSDA
jgi:hypothetical protein